MIQPLTGTRQEAPYMVPAHFSFATFSIFFLAKFGHFLVTCRFNGALSITDIWPLFGHIFGHFRQIENKVLAW